WERELLQALCEHAVGTVVLVPCEEAEVTWLVAGLRDVAWRSPLRVALSGVTEPEELVRARRALSRGAGPGSDVALGVHVDAAATALSVRALATQAAFFLPASTPPPQSE